MESTPDWDLRNLFRLTRLFRDESLELTARIEQLLPEVESFRLSPLNAWDPDSLARARHFAEEIVVLYVGYFYDPSRIPVTYYKREKAIRRHFDAQFARLFAEIIRRSGRIPEPELVTAEPIYYLLQKSREKRFPKGPKSQGHRPRRDTLKIRFHVDLACRLDPEDPEAPSAANAGDRRVLLPHELR
jgi:hypothetical protein